MKYLFDFFIGILIGFGAILPGISSGVFCVIFGIYEKIVNSILYFFKDFKKNFLFLFPITLGCIFGVVIFGNLIKYLFSTYKSFACFSFIGLILGTIPALLNKAITTKYISIKKLLPMFLSFIIGIGLIYLEKKLKLNNNITTHCASSIYLFFSGFIMSAGIVIPGVSNTILLMILGVYPTYISAVASVDLHILIPLGLGTLLGSIIWLKIMNLLFLRFHSETLLCIIGFTLGSVFILYPGIDFDLNGIISIIVFLICISISYYLSNINGK